MMSRGYPYTDDTPNGRLHITKDDLIALGACPEGLDWLDSIGGTIDIEWTRDHQIAAMALGAGPWLGWAVESGLVSLWSMHTTCSVFINESQQALEVDIKAFLEHAVARGEYYRHNDPDHSDCDRQNADSHLRAMMLGHSVTMQISGGELVVGQWQRVLCGELDGPRTRTVRAQVMGIS